MAVRTPIKIGLDISSQGVVRLRRASWFANRPAALRMTGERVAWRRGKAFVVGGIIAVVLLLIGFSEIALGTTYYVSSSAGSDANAGTSASAAWQTVTKVNGQAFVPGDSILFQRGGVWNESLVPPSSGVAGNAITFDAYGAGAAPNLTGYYAVASSAWVLVAGNAWRTALPSTYTTVNFCLFGSVWGQKVAAATSNLQGPWDFYFANGSLYVYSLGNPSSYYSAAIVPMALSNAPVIDVNAKSWLTFQHLLVNWFDEYGVYVQGASDHLVFANMEADSMIPQGTQPLGFYVNESAPGPGDIKIYNSEAHLNYDGFRFDGAASAITMVNDKGYGNRDAALVDNASAVTYSYCHFYASSLAVGSSTDVLWTSGTGPTAGVGNVAQDTDPAVQAFQRYPAQVTLTVDDAGMTPGADTYYANTVLPIADAAAVPVGAAVTVGYPLAQTLVTEFQGWINAGRDVTSHSMSHTYYTNTDALEIQYTGSGTAATLGISNKTLTITVTGASDSLSYNLAQGQTRGTIQGLRQALQATGKFTATEATPCQGPYGTGCSAFTEAALLAQDLADVSGQDVKSAVYHIQLDVTRLTTDEIALSRQWMTSHLTGLPASPVYVYPGGYETTTMQGITASVPYAGARGALKEDLGVKDTYASGFNLQNITSYGVNPTWQGLPPSTLSNKVRALVWKQEVWGVPWGIFWHLNELSSTEITNLIQDFQSTGATIQTNTSLVNWLLSGTQESGTDGNGYYKSAALSMTLDLRPTANSPVVDAGQNLGTTYQIDINGVNQNSYGNGWEIGAHAFVGYSDYGETNPPANVRFAIGGWSQPGGAVQLPQNWVNDLEINPPNGTYDVVATADGGAGAGHYAKNLGGLQQAVCDWVAAPDQWWLVKVPHGTVIDTTSTGYTCTQTGSTTVKALTLLTKIVEGTAPTKFLVFDSDQPLPFNRTVCAGGISDWNGVRQPPSGAISTWWTGGNNGCANDVGSMWTLEGNWSPGNIGMVIQAGTWDPLTGLGPSHYAFKDVELRPIAGNTAAVFVVNLDTTYGGGGTPTQPGELASHIHFTNVYGHGDATDWTGTAGGPGANHISTFVRMEGCQYCSVTFSYFDYIVSQGGESHVIAAGYSPGPLKIAHNWLSSASSAVFTGGLAVQNPLYALFDLEVRGNRLTNPASWIGTNYSGPSLGIKNRQEFKVCQRCLIDGNIAEYVDLSGVQNGQLFTLTPRNCSAGALCDNYQSTIQDVTITNNIGRHALTGIQMAGRSNYPGGNGGGATPPLRRINISNNLFYDLGNGTLYDANALVPSPYVIRPTLAGENFICSGMNVGGTITLNCAAGTAGLKQTQITAGDVVVVTSCSDPTWNVPGGSFLTQKGTTAFPGTTPSGLTVVYSNPGAVSSTATGCIVGNQEGFPAYLSFTHNTMVMKTTAGGRNNGHVYGGSVGAVSTDTGCTGGGPHNTTSISAISRASGIVTANVSSTTGWTSSLSGSQAQTLVEVSGSGDFNGTFYYLGQSGGNLEWMQTGPDETGTPGGIAQQMGTCPANQFLQNNVWKDNLLAIDVSTVPSCPNTPAAGWGGWLAAGGSNVEGCPSGVSNVTCSENELDVTNSVATYADFPGRCGAKYMEVGGAQANSSPPVTLTFPASTPCSGATADSTCVGMAGMMNGAAFDNSDSDYHNYLLVSSSQYKAGNANAADDGTDLGANLGAIDSAQAAVSAAFSTRPVPAAFFGLQSKPVGGTYPSAVKFGSYRLWDQAVDWATLNPANGSYAWSNLDAALAALKTHGVSDGVIYTFGVVPAWASSAPSDTGCDFGVAGGCDLPVDLNSDGTGSDNDFLTFVRALAQHVNDPTYLQTHAHIAYWEPWNEWYRNPVLGSFSGCATGSGCSIHATYAQMVHMTEDVRCAVTGTGTVNGVACAQSVIDPAAQILTPSTEAKNSYGSVVLENFLHCDDSPFAGSQCTTGDRGRQAINILNFHSYAMNTEAGEEVVTQASVLRSQLREADLALPIWSDEGGWGINSALPDADMQAAFVARYYLLGWSSGIPVMVWYEFDNQGWGTLCAPPANSCSLNKAALAYQQIYTWMAGNTMPESCAAAGTIYTCPIAKPDGTKMLAVWDTLKTCSGGTCQTSTYNYNPVFTQYYTLANGTSTTLTGGTVQIGTKPILLSQ
jgi:hypothetical protein